MLNVCLMTEQDQAYVMPRVHQFYTSDAVDHAVSEEVLEQTFEQAVSENPLITGFILEEEGKKAGYSYITHMYSTESGSCIMIEELYLDPSMRGKGLGHAFFHWLFRAYPDTARFRLEVTAENSRAEALYERLGFAALDYHQMIRER